MDRITLTWEAALADPSAAAVLLRRLEEKAEAYIARSRTMRQWLESVPPLTVMGTSPPTTEPEDRSARTPGPGAAPDGAPCGDGSGGGARTRDGRSTRGPRDGTRGRPDEEPSPPAAGDSPPAGPHEGRDRDGSDGGTVPPQRRTAGREEAGPGTADGQYTASAPRTGEDGRGQETAPPGDQQPTLYERVEALLEGFRPGAPQTARGIAQMIGHANLRSLRPILDRMAVRGLLVKTELHPRAVVYHRPETEGSAKEATMF
ncbi:hypothetical protein [Streptomyces anulatus]|uniref:hypothetical protein n=1 Tax=Streptomyces anulatus TaxID=1892 RepID=UPI0004CBB0D3|nr:hypothetical protein [Streptomyces anulatus]